MAGYEDGAVKIWDLKTSAVLHQVPASVHEMRVTAIDTHPDGNLMASISTDGKTYFLSSYAHVFVHLEFSIYPMKLFYWDIMYL